MIDIKNTFLKLTSTNYPYDKEYKMLRLLPEFKFQEDEFGNYYIIVKKPNGSFSNTMFTCHLDTYYVYGKYELKIPNEQQIKITHRFDGDFIKTDGTTILGADDKAGMVIMLNMISENVPGLYYFFLGEEIGRLGSVDLSVKFSKFLNKNKIPSINKCVSFDRKGYDFITTNQANKICCSDDFATDLSTKLNEYGFWYKKDSSGSRTDSHEFIDIITECTNISVGYFDEHTTDERQDIEFLELLAITCTKIDWEKITIRRKLINRTEFRSERKRIKYDGINNDNEFNSWYDSISNITC